MRSFLFVPGDSTRKFESAKKTAADALILDLEDSIAPEQKAVARGITRGMLDARHPGQNIYVRVNALDTGLTLGDLAAVMPGRPPRLAMIFDIQSRLTPARMTESASSLMADTG